MTTYISLRGVRENNLKNIDLNIPKNKLVVFTGVSGSGKSSILFSTIAVECQRQLYALFPAYIRHKLPKYERPKADVIENLSPAVIVDQKPLQGNARSTVGTIIDIQPLFRLLFSRVGVPNAGTASRYSFNDPKGMCPACSGFGKQIQLNVDQFLDREKSLNQGAIQFSQLAVGTWQWKIYALSGLFDADEPLKNFTQQQWDHFLHGVGHEMRVKVNGENLSYDGLIDRFNRLWLNRDISTLKPKLQREVQSLLIEKVCPTCHGQRLNQEILASKIDGLSLGDHMDLEIIDLIEVIKKITDPIGQPIAQKILEHLHRIDDIGLGYLTIGRTTSSLSGGEGQRLKLIRHLGSSLTNMLFILDEPSSGLHPRDIYRLNNILFSLRDKGNSVLVVEHDRDVIAHADEIIDVGPLAGQHGGEVVFQGSFQKLLTSHTVTGESLKRKPILKVKREHFKTYLDVVVTQKNNIQQVKTQIPFGGLTVITGVAGSGKSTLLSEGVIKNHTKAIVIDQNLVGSSSRSTPATYTGTMDIIRKLMADHNQVNMGLFSFNSTGACPVCQGKGEILPDMVFADPVAIQCESCHGTRYSNEALSYTYQTKNISDILTMTIDEALDFFQQPNIQNRLFSLKDVGLGYLTLGQPVSTLSGGEKQRMKMASELHKDGQIYIMDEPSTGLHVSDVDILLQLIQRMVANHNTVVIAEHHLDVIAAADWVIDMGPEGGKHGGTIVFEGTPAALVEAPNSHTGAHLKRILTRE